ncbi:4-hydroxybenzoate polyprenyltransferase [Pedobacter steynii]|uniref:4-hydroxybenzoate polyprenyltransferase n=1 Tax=Pedobacter steynii TaxID=430522 RepID=A0A1G9UT39_9SPHI|nr:UbiA-like protein EboC [Pedobacter steynii]NQX40868.1 UbiA-like protein EboC [Pedobacter steynii]SDM63073.1 4-hydroxybenzoate polyprenyltransferase [Pedobacter steynii]
MNKILGYLRLMRPANVVTAVADVLAGIAIAGYFSAETDLFPVILLCLSTIGLYSGGIIMNDVFDAELDAIERPERPIPSGLISKKSATIFAGIFFFIGIFSAGLYHSNSQYLAAAVMISALVYNKFLKHHLIFGPINMGLCRGLNLLLGVSVIPAEIQHWWFLALVPIVYIGAITMISRGEVHGGQKKTLYFAALLYFMVIAAILTVAQTKGNLLPSLIFILPFAVMIFSPLFRAIQQPIGKNIGKAVKSGVIALILMNAAWAAAFGVFPIAIFIVVLLPISLLLGKAFAVT